ncbi:MAG: hypothetical protein BJ554DRAFT_7217 [Olpidium bornovanus]|uniref:Uncharacterized protein n=1 Tax=Olpidium bornovanus TaxID=278681 RepID=A0A8H7ZWI0_9FUNG|nr:MAG: hypothetical protein BJ554DRAFT_7217 [Olpidium bornovanus]KAG5460695.1 MAG: hypothetical protein BJ554DRAFT_7217 [Olpidium bornovanus]
MGKTGIRPMADRARRSRKKEGALQSKKGRRARPEDNVYAARLIDSRLDFRSRASRRPGPLLVDFGALAGRGARWKQGRRFLARRGVQPLFSLALFFGPSAFRVLPGLFPLREPPVVLLLAFPLAARRRALGPRVLPLKKAGDVLRLRRRGGRSLLLQRFDELWSIVADLPDGLRNLVPARDKMGEGGCGPGSSHVVRAFSSWSRRTGIRSCRNCIDGGADVVTIVYVLTLSPAKNPAKSISFPSVLDTKYGCLSFCFRCHSKYLRRVRRKQPGHRAAGGRKRRGAKGRDEVVRMNKKKRNVLVR